MTGALYICRHGEREDWINSVWQEDADFPYDPPLSHDGMRHAQELGRRMARRVSKAGASGQIDLILSSPFWRTLQTAGVANRWIHAPIRVMTELCPQITGKHKEFNATPDLEYNSLPSKMLEFNFPGLKTEGPVAVPKYPEAPVGLQERSRNVAQYIATELCAKKGMNVFVVTHRANAEIMLKTLCGAPDAKVTTLPGFCSLVKLVADPVSRSWMLEYSHPGEKERHATGYNFKKYFKGPLKHRPRGEKGVEAKFEHMRSHLARHQGQPNVVPLIPAMPAGGPGPGAADNWDSVSRRSPDERDWDTKSDNFRSEYGGYGPRSARGASGGHSSLSGASGYAAGRTLRGTYGYGY
eukprot:tig00000405_g492.t1